MTRVLTRVCTKCRTRKALADFYHRERGKTGYRAECIACVCAAARHRWHRTLRPNRPPRFFRCRYCNTEDRQRAPNQEVCSAVSCQRQLKQERNRRYRKQPRRLCLDCHGPSFFRRCDRCRTLYQEQQENAALGATPGRADLCGCGQPLKFGSDPMTGVTLEFCMRCGERPVPIIGARHYDQRITLDDEIEEAVERSGRAPDQRYAGLGMHFRQKSNEFTRKSA